ncbi:glucose-1-phosphate cytidylyltransferase [Geobacter sulfurreducens]|uniref:glucose-1-phosphate cytidylyltransferase n=1 Tax=Geobacter sulfurreducens TaxID=35554 RepID=UPI0001D8F170|nr:glucose-1-phosphate cytidylyltransferase [Geobacter sulfurreducens]ADI85770.1 glucose-1-phosphate cytidylyltransferase [Geobacter sulfurreducens KN400]BBA71415.1 Glucose-1-phosphate cytidylyltransferase [Geobacter sulfurreducens]
MKVVIFAGGLGTRISEESYLRPKPMIEIGEKPILWHLMKIYEAQGFNEFIICLGYKGFMIKQYFMNYYLYNSDVTFNLQTNSFEIHQTNTEKFRITLVETGLHTRTAGRLKRVQQYVGKEEFMLTYGDGLADVNLQTLLEYHRSHGKIATVTAVQPAGRFGLLGIDDHEQVTNFKEKPLGDGGWINGGFFVLKPEIFSYLPENADDCMWEEYPLENLANDDQLMAYKHHGFWKCMDALRDKEELERMWNSGHAQWKNW